MTDKITIPDFQYMDPICIYAKSKDVSVDVCVGNNSGGIGVE